MYPPSAQSHFPLSCHYMALEKVPLQPSCRSFRYWKVPKCGIKVRWQQWECLMGSLSLRGTVVLLMTLLGLTSFNPHRETWKGDKRRDPRTMEYPGKGPTRITEAQLIKLDLLGCEGPTTTILVTKHPESTAGKWCHSGWEHRIPLHSLASSP